MTDTYSTSQRFTKQQVATNRLVWGNILNSGLIALLDEAIAANVSIDVTAGNVTLSDINGASSQARAVTLLVTGSPGSVRTIFVPTRQKVYNVHNASGQTVTVRTTGGTGVQVTNGSRATVFVDEETNEVYQPALHRAQTVQPDTTTMDPLAGTVTNATGGTTNPTLYSHREGDHVSISCNTISVTVAALTFGISVTLPFPPDEDITYPQWILEGTTPIEALLQLFPSSILILKADGSNWTNPSTRVIPAMTFSYRIG